MTVLTVVDKATGRRLRLHVCDLCGHWVARSMRRPAGQGGRYLRTCSCACHPRTTTTATAR